MAASLVKAIEHQNRVLRKFQADPIKLEITLSDLWLGVSSNCHQFEIQRP
jgi:hypothetical protein